MPAWESVDRNWIQVQAGTPVELPKWSPLETKTKWPFRDKGTPWWAATVIDSVSAEDKLASMRTQMTLANSPKVKRQKKSKSGNKVNLAQQIEG